MPRAKRTGRKLREEQRKRKEKNKEKVRILLGKYEGYGKDKTLRRKVRNR